MNAAQPGRMMLTLLIVPGAGFIFLFLSAAIAMTFLQSIGLYSLVGESQLTVTGQLRFQTANGDKTDVEVDEPLTPTAFTT